MSVLDLVSAVLLGLWLCLTLLNQLNTKFVRRLIAWDKVGFLPGYRFFAPHPGRYDYHLLVRYQVPGRSFTS